MEITGSVGLSTGEKSLIDMHSVLNVFNVVTAELGSLSRELGGPAELKLLMENVIDTARSLRDPEFARRQVEHIESFIEMIESTVSAAIDAVPESVQKVSVRRSRENLRSIFAILRIRAREIIARAASSGVWVWHDIEALKKNFLHVFAAIELNSRGEYRIVYNVAEHEVRDYLVHFEITSVDGDRIEMPAVFQDVMRDLIANSRKYTPPGGRITAGLHGSEDDLRFVVLDTGVGIPAEEIERVVLFGERGRNVIDRPTKGGGFGLTKALHVTQRSGGRMWIDSPVEGDRGTRVEIRIPRPRT